MNKLILISLMLAPVFGLAEGHEKIYAGTYVWGAEVHSFTACNENDGYWVSFDWAGNEMHEFYRKEVVEPYQLMYIEFRGQVLNEVVDGFADQYAGLIRISEVRKYTFKVPASCK